jgi:hypothetical protein
VTSKRTREHFGVGKLALNRATSVFVKGHPSARFISDLNGFDPSSYNGERGLVFAIMAWLATRLEAVGTLPAHQVLKGLPEFKRQMRSLRKNWDDRPPWADVVLAALKIAKWLSR